MTRERMRIAAATIAFVLAGGFGFIPVAHAQSGITVNDVSNVLLSKGFKSEVTHSKDGTPVIESASNGLKFLVFFTGCKAKPQCATLQFYAGFSGEDIPQSRVNEWNRTTRFGKAYIMKDEAVALEMDMYVERGVTAAAIGGDLEVWDSIIGEFREFLRSR